MRGRPLRIAALTAAAAAALAVAPAAAQTVDELNSRIANAQAQAQSLGAQVQASEAQLAGARAQASAAAQREAQLSAVLAQGQEREAALSRQVATTQARLDQTRAKLHRAKGTLSDRVVAIYKGSVPSESELILQANGFDDLATRSDLLGRIEAADSRLAQRVARLKDQVAAQLQAVKDARDQQAAENARVAAARDQIDAVRARAEARAADLQAAQRQQSAALASLRSQVAAWEQQVQAAQQVSAAQAQATVAGWFGDWAIPQAIVMCESGGNFHAVNSSSGAGGAYQIMPSTWRMYGGQGAPQDASPQEQSRIAHQIWADSGPSAWACAQ